jgi:dihydrofolate synthase/folylpolyglutamate synthase
MTKKITVKEAHAFIQNTMKSAKNYTVATSYLKRARFLLELLGSPQNDLKVIHVAGTSGKGTTAYFISALLQTLGKNVGLHIKPHIFDIRERFQINGQLVSDEEYSTSMQKIIEAYHIMEKHELGPPSSFEIATALAYFTFKNHNVDYAIMETGIGGTYDATNTVERDDKVAVLTRIGLDHTQFLGDTVEKIAVEKANIIQPHNPVIALWQSKGIREVFNKKADQQHSSIEYVQKDVAFSRVRSTPKGMVFNYSFQGMKIKDLFLSMVGEHQVENAAIALASVLLVTKRDNIFFDEQLVRTAFSHAYLLGRFHRVTMNGKEIVIDGAHNEQKMESLVRALETLQPKKQHVFLLAFKDEKDILPMIRVISRVAARAILTGFKSDKQDWIVESRNPHEVAQLFDSLNYSSYTVIEDCSSAFQQGLSEVSGQERLVVTGSMYLLGELYPLIIEDR